jgi:hypothetical protein
MDPPSWECMGKGVDSPGNDIAQEGGPRWEARLLTHPMKPQWVQTN